LQDAFVVNVSFVCSTVACDKSFQSSRSLEYGMIDGDQNQNVKFNVQSKTDRKSV